MNYSLAYWIFLHRSVRPEWLESSRRLHARRCGAEERETLSRPPPTDGHDLERCDPQQLASVIEQAATAVARIDGRVSLDHKTITKLRNAANRRHQAG